MLEVTDPTLEPGSGTYEEGLSISNELMIWLASGGFIK